MKCKCKEIKSIDLDKIERIPIPKYPKWYEDEMQKRVDFIKSVSGVSPELMGPVEDEEGSAMSRKKNLVTTVEEIPLELIYGEYKWGRVYDEYQEMIISNKTNINIVVSVCGRQDNALIEPNTFMMPIREKYLHYPYLFIRRWDADKEKEIEGNVTITIVRKE